MVHNNFSLLLDNFDSNWERLFEDRIRVIGDETVQGMEEAMIFLQYSCQTPSCGAIGMCSTFCFYCPHLGAVKKDKKRSDFDEEGYQAWKRLPA